MTDLLRITTDGLSTLSVSCTPSDHAKTGSHLTAELTDRDKLRSVADYFLNHGFFIGFVTANHTSDGISVIYQFARFDQPFRVILTVMADSKSEIPTISDIFHGADWHERETRDFYGVVFTDHPNLIPLILAEEDVDLKPLLKGDKRIKTLDQVTYINEGEKSLE